MLLGHFHSLFFLAATLFSHFSWTPSLHSDLYSGLLDYSCRISLSLHPALCFFIARTPIWRIIFLFLCLWRSLLAYATISSMKIEALFCSLLCYQYLEECPNIGDAHEVPVE